MIDPVRLLEALRQGDPEGFRREIRHHLRAEIGKKLERERPAVFAAIQGLSEEDFRRLARLVYDTCGIKLPAPKKSMLEARLRKRLRSLKMKSFAEYCDYLFSHGGIEHGGVRRDIGGVHRKRTDARRTAHLQVGRNIVQFLLVAASEEDRVATFCPLTRCRLGNRRRCPDDENLLHCLLHGTPPEAGGKRRIDEA